MLRKWWENRVIIMAGDADIITLSSDEEDQSPPEKRVKLINIDTSVKQPSLKTFLKPEYCIVLSDEEDDKAEKKNSATIIPTNTDDDDKAEFITKAPNNEAATTKTDDNTSDEVQNDSIINIEEDEMSPQSDLVLDTDENNKIQETSEPVIINDKSLVTSESAANDSTKDLVEINLLTSCNESDDEDTIVEEQDPNAEEFFVFLDDCLQLFTTDPAHKDLLHSKLPIVKKFFEKIKHYSYNKEEFREVIRRSTRKINGDSRQIMICFTEVYQWLKSSYLNLRKEQSNVVKNRRMVKKLHKALIKIRRRLRALENAEIDWDDEENSVYLQYERYSSRAVQLYKKLCQCTDDNPHEGRLVYLRLDFSHSEYTEINRAINRKYKNNKEFPTYFELDKLIRKCVKEHNLDISENLLQYEIKQCFEKLGKLLQKRRKLDSCQFLQDFLEDPNDPAQDNPEIEDKLKANQNTYSKKLDEVFEKYSKLQETGYDPSVSSDSDDSHYAESDSEEKMEETTNN